MSVTNPLNLDGLLPPAAASTTSATRNAVGQDFAATLTATAADRPNAASSLEPDELREAADQLVATAFILPLLEQARNDPFKSDLFHGGKGEEVFGQQLDVIYADNITRSANFGITDALVARFRGPESSNETKVNLRG